MLIHKLYLFKLSFLEILYLLFFNSAVPTSSNSDGWKLPVIISIALGMYTCTCNGWQCVLFLFIISVGLVILCVVGLLAVCVVVKITRKRTLKSSQGCKCYHQMYHDNIIHVIDGS